jgi:dihydrofolate reductase
MRRITVVNHVTLDGVMQSPAHPDEDRRGGFEHGGWTVPYADEVMAGVMAEGMAKAPDLLLGRRTYEHFAAFWPHQTDDNPYTPVLNAAQKHVASRTLRGPLPWVNSTLLEGDAADAVAALKQQPGKDLVNQGSGELVQSLMHRNLIDEYQLTIHPLVLGSGRRLFEHPGSYATLRLIDSRTTTTGVIIATYQSQEATR